MKKKLLIIYRIIKYQFASVLKYWKTLIFKKLNWSDIGRWSKTENLHENWNQRTILLSDKIKDGSRILEFGSGNLFLKDNLPKNCTYINSDIVKRDENTIVIDLNKKIPPLPKVDYIVFSGVLEYVYDVEHVLNECGKYTENLLLSYATLDYFPSVKNRRINGWVSDLYLKDFNNISFEIDYNMELIGNWNGQQLIKLAKKNKTQ